MKSKLLTVLALVFCIGSVNTWAEESASPDCATAEEDISNLEQQKKSKKGLLSYTPIGMVAGAVKKDSEEDKKKAREIDEHNKGIDAQIGAIKQACNIQ